MIFVFILCSLQIHTVSLRHKKLLFKSFCFPTLSRVYPGQGKCDKLFSEMECLKKEDISEAVLYVLGSHPRVNVNDIIIRPTEQLE